MPDAKKLFLIKYRDPETQEWQEVEQEFSDSPECNLTARDWAEDVAYNLADKGPYTIEEIVR